MYNRLLFSPIQKSPKSVLLLGPRQVGKSTLIQELNPDLSINFSNEGEFFDFQSNPVELQQRLESSRARTIFIDEVQRIPRVLNSVQDILDQNSRLKFYLTGSSARKLRRSRANLLPGRVFTYQMAPLSLLELNQDWSNSFALKFGSLPGIYGLKNDLEIKKLLRSYSNVYLKEEIMAESLVRGVDGFVRFLREAATFSGSFLDYSKLAQRAKVPRQSVVRHFEILEDTLLVKKTESDPDMLERDIDLVKHPKFFFFDLGVVNALRGSFEISTDRIGFQWEHLVFNQMINTGVALDLDFDIFNFRTRGGLEVDFIFSMEGKKTAIECKSSAQVLSQDLGNLREISKYYSKINKIVLYPGKVEKKESDVWILPLRKGLEVLGLRSPK